MWYANNNYTCQQKQKNCGKTSISRTQQQSHRKVRTHKRCCQKSRDPTFSTPFFYLRAIPSISPPNHLLNPLQAIPVDHSEDLMSLSESPPSSVGDSVYNSPKPPRSSKDFDDVMVKLKRHNDVQHVRSFDDVTMEDSDGETRASHFPLSSSLPPEPVTRRKGRRTVRKFIFGRWR